MNVVPGQLLQQSSVGDEYRHIRRQRIQDVCKLRSGRVIDQHGDDPVPWIFERTPHDKAAFRDEQAS